jgi:hypothetical protein
MLSGEDAGGCQSRLENAASQNQICRQLSPFSMFSPWGRIVTLSEGSCGDAGPSWHRRAEAGGLAPGRRSLYYGGRVPYKGAASGYAFFESLSPDL